MIAKYHLHTSIERVHLGDWVSDTCRTRCVGNNKNCMATWPRVDWRPEIDGFRPWTLVLYIRSLDWNKNSERHHVVWLGAISAAVMTRQDSQPACAATSGRRQPEYDEHDVILSHSETGLRCNQHVLRSMKGRPGSLFHRALTGRLSRNGQPLETSKSQRSLQDRRSRPRHVRRWRLSTPVTARPVPCPIEIRHLARADSVNVVKRDVKYRLAEMTLWNPNVLMTCWAPSTVNYRMLGALLVSTSLCISVTVVRPVPCSWFSNHYSLNLLAVSSPPPPSLPPSSITTLPAGRVSWALGSLAPIDPGPNWNEVAIRPLEGAAHVASRSEETVFYQRCTQSAYLKRGRWQTCSKNTNR